MQKTYQPQQIEPHWAQYWQAHGHYQPQQANGNSYSITLPPPNITGTLHMGHGFQLTLMDALIRYQRMQGANVLWQPGTDHAGIATQMVVERELAKTQQTRHDIGREQFIERVWQWREQSGSTITGQIKRLGASLDWSRERFSMDENLSRATTEAFIRLHESGLIYRGKRLVNWDPQLNTAISDLEVVNKEVQGSLWHLRYPLASGDGHLVVATTRPETMLGDTAVAVHPEDERYQHLIGQQVLLPLANRTIPIIADDAVDREFGSGCVKITPAHDFNDYEIGKRHNLAMLNIMTFDGHLNQDVPKAYRGMQRFAARKQVVADLEKLELIEKIQAHTLQVPYGDRSNAVIEPMLTDQWFVRMQSLAEPALAAVDNGDLKFIPHNWNKTYCQWLENIQDWCISRQLWWGHRIPVWFDEQGNHFVGYDEADARARHNLPADLILNQDQDVLDTWFTASLCPFSSLGWPQQTADLKTFYPNSVLVTGFDIIFFWVARMVMMGLYFLKQVPFKEVYITGLIRDASGQKMSKSKGNILDPIDLVDGVDVETLIKKRTLSLMQPSMAGKIEKQTKAEFPQGIDAYGTDALRFTFCALATTGRDINFDMGRIEGYRNFCNKLWNATRFVLMQMEEQTLDAKQLEPSIAELWIVTKLEETIIKAHQAFADYRFDLLAQYLYEFTWNEYCDWYLELAKCILNDNDASEVAKNTARHTLLSVLEKILRLLHPLIPYITEEIWQTLAPMLNISGDSIMLQPYPQAGEISVNTAACDSVDWLKQVVAAIRNVRGEMAISPAKNISILCFSQDSQDQQRLANCQQFVQKLAKVDQISWPASQIDLPASATTLVNQLEIHIPLAGLVDKTQEIARLNKEISKLQKELQKCEQKLNNPNYINKAPKAVVAKEQQKLNESKNALNKLAEHYARIEAL